MATAIYRRIAFFGPSGTNTEEALRSQTDLLDAEHVSCTTITEVVDAVESGTVDAGVVPVESQIEGSVGTTLDLLVSDRDVLIRREIVIVVDLVLVGHAGADPAAATEVLSYPHAVAQCRGRLATVAPHAEFAAANSTADAVRIVAAGGPERLAIGTRYAAELHGLAVLDDDITDHEGAETRFLLLGKGVPARTGADKTSIVVHLGEDRPGGLLAILQEFAARGLNLTKIESRPTKGGLGQYWFFIDIEGHLGDALVQDALRGLEFRFGDVRFLGSYPRARHGDAVEERRQEADWAAAGERVDALVELIEDEGT